MNSKKTCLQILHNERLLYSICHSKVFCRQVKDLKKTGAILDIRDIDCPELCQKSSNNTEEHLRVFAIEFIQFIFLFFANRYTLLVLSLQKR